MRRLLEKEKTHTLCANFADLKPSCKLLAVSFQLKQNRRSLTKTNGGPKPNLHYQTFPDWNFFIMERIEVFISLLVRLRLFTSSLVHPCQINLLESGSII